MKTLFSILLISGFVGGILLVIAGIIVFIDDYMEPSVLGWVVLGLFCISISFRLRPELKKLSWNDDFFYLFFMTFSKRIIRRHRSLKQKMREELKDEFKN